ncbi:MAG: 50S ribosomal protein L24 [Candidatus Micrarchaeia archaeon]
MKLRRPRTQRKKRFSAPLHIRGKFVHSHLSKDLQKKIKKRSIRVRKGDKVKIVRGDFRGKEGKVVNVSLKKCKIFVEGVTRKKARGQEVLVPIDPSNVIIVELAERK